MDIKAAIIDLDGTLLNSDKQVSRYSEMVLEKTVESGMHLMIATARPPRMVDPLFAIVRKAEFIIYLNGALIRREGQPFGHCYPISTVDLKNIHRFFRRLYPDAYLIYETEQAWYANRTLSPEEAALYSRGQRDFRLPEIKSQADIEEIGVYKILFDKGGGVMEAFEKVFGNTLHVGYMLGGNPVEVMNGQMSKEMAAEEVLRLLNIDPRDVIVFGDEYNDTGLFELCGHPVAMGNAIDAVKEKAKTVTETNDNNGVAMILEKLIETGEV